MRVIYIPIRKGVVINLLIAVILLSLFLSMGGGEAFTVFNTLMKNPIYKGDENIEMVAFECNVVWGTEYVPKMLDILDERDIKITFFIGGEWADDNPELLKRMVREGHEIGNHGYSHKHHSKLNLDENCREITVTEEKIKEITGVKTSLFAPPYGEFNEVTVKAADSLGYKTIMWSIDTIDWKREGVDKIMERVLRDPHNGAFILMHPTEYTVQALPGMIAALENRGYEIGRISDLLD